MSARKHIAQPENLPVPTDRYGGFTVLLGDQGTEAAHEVCSCGSRRTKLSSPSQLFFQAYISSVQGYGVKCPHTAPYISANAAIGAGTQ